MNLIIDIGNTATKISIFDDEKKIIKHVVVEYNTTVNSIEIFKNQYQISYCIISSVVGNYKSLLLYCKENFKTIILSNKTPIPIINGYRTPKTLGNDRLSCSVAMANFFKNKNSLSIDFGTCIKYDFVEKGEIYKGGAISLGLKMRFQALHKLTSQLPLVNPSSNCKIIGNTTETSIMSGVQNGIILEVNGFIDKYIAQYKDLKVVITGGDYKYFENELKNITFADRYLVQKGLNEILEHNKTI